MKKLVVALFIMAVSFSCKDIGTVSPDWFITDIEGYQLIFKDTQGKVYTAMGDINSEFITVKKILKKNGEDWVVTTKLEDALVAVSFEEVADLQDADVVKIPISKISVYKRIVR